MEPEPVVLEIREEPGEPGVSHEGSAEGRRALSSFILPRLQEEFGPRLVVDWREQRETCSRIRLRLDGMPLDGWRDDSGEYLSLSMLRLQIALRLSLRSSLTDLLTEAQREATEYSPGAVSWQDGFLSWSSSQPPADQETPGAS